MLPHFALTPPAHRPARGKRARRIAPRATPPLVHSSGRRGENVAPLSAINPDTLYSANEWIAGLAGGSVGVLGTLIQLELKQVSAGVGRVLGNSFCKIYVVSCFFFRFISQLKPCPSKVPN